MEILHNTLHYITWRGDDITGGLVGLPIEPKGFMLAMVAVRHDGWVALVDGRVLEQFADEFLKGPDVYTAVTIVV